MTKDQDESSTTPIDPEIVKEAQRFLRENKDLKVQSYDYTSPRISSEIPDCSMPMTFDQYNYCSLSCLYCFAYFFKTNSPAYKGHQIPLKAVNVDKMIAAMQGHPKDKRGQLMYEHFYKREFLLHWGGLADPFCNFEHSNRQGFKLIEALAEMNYPTLFSFKGNDIFSDDYVKLFEKYGDQSNFAFQISIVTNSDKMAQKVEIGNPSTTKRLEALKMLSDMGYWTILRLRPFIMGLTDIGLDELLDRAKECGISGISTEWFALDARSNEGMKRRFRWLGDLMGTQQLQKYYSTLSPSSRGGYMRLNRKVKEPYVKQIYKFCVENDITCGISDPDFKELNTSGSCCGMPDDFPKNRKLENWTRNQITYHIKRARQRYHQTGQPVYLRFNEVYGEESYLDNIELAQEHVSVINKPRAERKAITQRHILQEHWNNLRSPQNPRNYFHGKLMPVNTDENGNLIFKYEPLEYEDRWEKEGIDLTK